MSASSKRRRSFAIHDITFPSIAILPLSNSGGYLEQPVRNPSMLITPNHLYIRSNFSFY